jgi:hypothetical protein
MSQSRQATEPEDPWSIKLLAAALVSLICGVGPMQSLFFPSRCPPNLGGCGSRSSASVPCSLPSPPDGSVHSSVPTERVVAYCW